MSLSTTFEQHMQRIRAATTQRLHRRDAARWIEQNTYINGRRFSFKDHEYQERILLEEAPDVVVTKCAQVGISEMSLRLAAALPQIMPGAFRIGYVMPSATAATDYAQARFGPVVRGSPALRSVMTSEDLDKADTKTFGSPDKVVYFKGAAVGNAAISTTLDMTIMDEYSFMDQGVAGDYHSRLLHSSYQWTLKLSTPTFPGDPISTAFQASRQHFNFCRCNHCGHRFLPNFYDHVRVPGWDRHLDEITSSNLHRVRHEEAQLHCPACGSVPSLAPQHREWVLKNPDESHRAVGFQVSPFDAPRIVSVPSLIIASTKYNTKTKFRQFSLGTPDEDAENGFTEEELDAASFAPTGRPDGEYFIGFDQGNTCHLVVGCLDNQDRLKAVHWERCALGAFEKCYADLKAKWGVRRTKVGDKQPNVTLSMKLSDEDPQFFPAVYSTRQGIDVYDVVVREEDEEDGTQGRRQVEVNRNTIFDRLLLEVREGRLLLGKTNEWETVKLHLRDMKRAQATLRNGEFSSLWVKSTKGNDHYHHALAYLWLAAQIRGVVRPSYSPGMFTVGKFRVRTGAVSA